MHSSSNSSAQHLLQKRDMLRRELRLKRRALPPWRQRRHADMLRTQLWRHPLWRRTERIGAFVANDGELDPAALLRRGGDRKKIYLPVLRSPTKMVFVRWRKTQACRPGCHGIPAPRGRAFSARRLGLVLMPLVACDTKGYRLGRGAGYYDRCLSFLCERNNDRQPLLLGIGHTLQYISDSMPQARDVPLSGMCTERQLHWFKPCARDKIQHKKSR